MSIQGPCTAASSTISAWIASVESSKGGGSPGAVSMGAKALPQLRPSLKWKLLFPHDLIDAATSRPDAT